MLPRPIAGFWGKGRGKVLGWGKEKERGGVRVLSNCVTKHNKLSRRIQNTAQIDIFTTRKRSKIVAARHISWAQNYQNCGQGFVPDPTAGAYSTPQTS